MEAISLHFLPWLSPVILYACSTLSVLFCFIATPYLVYQSVQSEQHAQKSLKEKAYMRRLLITEILNVLVIPILFNVLIVVYRPPNYRGIDSDQPSSILATEDPNLARFIDIIAFSEE